MIMENVYVPKYFAPLGATVERRNLQSHVQAVSKVMHRALNEKAAREKGEPATNTRRSKTTRDVFNTSLLKVMRDLFVYMYVYI